MVIALISDVYLARPLLHQQSNYSLVIETKIMPYIFIRTLVVIPIINIELYQAIMKIEGYYFPF